MSLTKRPFTQRLRHFIALPNFPKQYAIFSIAVLGVTTVFWSLLGARLNAGNADQLVNSYLFEHSSTLHNAFWPAQHNFLIKWPIFYLIKLFGFSSSAFIFFSILCVTLTVGFLAAIIYRVERRPLVFGSLMLALASVLLMIPAQPYAGGILPVNMAMIATRNLEYAVYIASLFLIIRSPSIRTRKFWLGIASLGILIASDRLFLSLSVGGALLALIAYALRGGWNLVSLSVRWLVAGILASGVGLAILGLINSSGFTNIAGQGSASPYGLIHSFKDFGLGIFYGFMGLLTNFGANPAYDSTVVRQVPHQFIHRLLSFSGPAYFINLLVLTTGLVAAYKLGAASFKLSQREKPKGDALTQLPLILIWTSLAALAIFALTKHYYAVDARYLSISLFALFIAAATYLRDKKWSAERLVIAGTILCLSVLVGIVSAARTNSGQEAALADINHRNQLVAQILTHHKVDFLVGDYWRVVPTRLQSHNMLSVMSLEGCTTPRKISSSNLWQPDLNKHSFAYLLSLDSSLTGYPNCSLQQAIDAYGRPNTSVIVAGSQNQPKELLLFYDRGVRHSSPVVVLKTPSTVLPIPLSQLPYTSCPNGTTVMNVVAHQDDDLLFINPDTLHDIQSGHCIRTIYITAGDSGSGSFYWLSREQGSEAAYSTMTGSKELWIQRIVQLPDQQYVMVAHPRADYQVSLIFMRLPDGNLKGQGFLSSYFESLSNLETGKLRLMHSVDSQSQYSLVQLTDAIVALMRTYQPSEVRTQTPLNLGTRFPDHSDHTAVGRLVQKAVNQYDSQQFEGQAALPISFYTGYPIREKPANVSGRDLSQKEAAFLTYAQHDTSVCRSDAECNQSLTYGAYLARQYRYTP